jgi:hypothetical protein
MGNHSAVIRALASIAAGLLLFAACSHAPRTAQAQLAQGAVQMRETIAATVAQPARRAELLERADRFERILQRYAGDFGEFEQGLQRANAAYDAGPGQIKALFAQFDEKRRAARAELMGVHFEMLARTSAVEWERIGKAEVEMLQTMGAR